MSYARKVDTTHQAIRDALRKCGMTVIDTSRLSGFVDFVAKKGDRIFLIEAKTPQSKAGRILKTDAQKRLEQNGWSVVFLTSAVDAMLWAQSLALRPQERP